MLKRKLFCLFLAFVLVFSLTPSVSAADIVGSGECGNHATWSITNDGVLTISGTGETNSYRLGEQPWYNYRITSIIIEEGITSLGSGLFEITSSETNTYSISSVSFPSTLQKIMGNTFKNCKGITEIYLPEGFTFIGAHSFRLCSGLKTIHLPSTLMEIRSRAFEGDSSLKDVYYNGTQAMWESFTDAVNAIPYIGEKNDELKNATWHFSGYEPTDVPSDWAKIEISYAIQMNLVPNSLQKNYQSPISRGNVANMFVKLIEKSSGKDIETLLAEKNVVIDPNVFTDTSDPDVLAMNALGIINGIGDGLFDPDGTLTRAQIAAIINRIARVMGIDTSGYTHAFTDVKGHWVDSELGWPVNEKIILGVGDNKFDPDSFLTTEQAILITGRSLKAFNRAKNN